MPKDNEPKVVELDDSGPGAQITFPEEKQAEEKESNETIIETIEDSNKSDNAPEKSDESVDVRDEQKQELKEGGVSKYDGGVQGLLTVFGFAVAACDLTFVESLCTWLARVGFLFVICLYLLRD